MDKFDILQRENEQLKRHLAELMNENYYQKEDIVSIKNQLGNRLGFVKNIENDIVEVKFFTISDDKALKIDRTSELLQPICQNPDAYWGR